MEILLNPILELGKCLCRFGWKHSDCLLNLKENLESLETKLEQLNNLKQDVLTRVEQEEQHHRMKRTNQVDSWLQKAEQIVAEAAKLLQQASPYGNKCFLAKNCRSSYKLGRQVSKMIGEIDELKNQGNFDVLVHRMPRCPGDEIPMDETVGSDSMFDRVWSSIEDENTRTMGLYGIGGVGKTTLLKRINNQFSNTNHDFAYVIWVVVSRNVDVNKVQETVRNKLEIPNLIWLNRSEDERAAEIYKILKNKKIVVLLDDIWERFDLSRIGVPYPDSENRSKLIFTTRSEEVCAQMDANRRFRVECLPTKAAFELFSRMVGKEVLESHQEIPKLAEIVAEECQGLPLALITIGRAMASRKNPKEWNHTIKTLKTYPSKFSGMQDRVFPILGFSYDSLSDETLKKCFLYCALYPEDYRIPKNELIDLWIGEGIINKYRNTSDGRNEGEFIINSLKLACLLEGDEFEDRLGMSMGDFIWMHDVIRDMALWLACEQKNGNFFVIDDPDTIKPKGEETQKLSLWEVEAIRGFLIFPNLETLFVRNCGFATCPSKFLHHVQNLKVLDLSGNTKLATLPEGIGGLLNLEYLNLSWTGIFELSIEIKNLKKLKSLILDDTRFLRVIRRHVIPSLISLKVFSKLASADFLFDEELNEVELLEDLEQLENLDDLSINLWTKTSTEKFLDSVKLRECVRQLRLMDCSEMNDLSFSLMSRLEKLDIKSCHSLSKIEAFPAKYEVFLSLRMVHIRFCSVRDLTWLIHAESLETLEVYNCVLLEEVVSVDSEKEFRNLSRLYLVELPNLKWICEKGLLVPRIAKITVLKCLKMKRLPFDSRGCESLKVIRGERSWWDGLQWENEQVRDVLGEKFVDYGSGYI